MSRYSRIGIGHDKPGDDLDSRFRRPLLAYFLKRVHSLEEAEDLTQEAFIRLARHQDKTQSEGALAYVFTIASNLVKDRARLHVARQTSGHRSLGSHIEDVIAAPQLIEDRTPERVIIGQETLKDVVGALEELGERTRDIFILSRLENMKHRDIAALHGITVSAVEKHVMKALAHLGARFLRQ
jgi:RNA polymerase sigma factor (sigma-70 family)